MSGERQAAKRLTARDIAVSYTAANTILTAENKRMRKYLELIRSECDTQRMTLPNPGRAFREQIERYVIAALKGEA